MRILVTGGLGYIGSHIILNLIGNGHVVYSADNNCRSINNAKNVIENMTKVSIRNFDVDLSKEIIESKFMEGVDCIIHCAGYKCVGESKQDPILYYKNNIVSALNVLEIMKKYEIKNLIFSSSCTVYGSQNNIITEKSEIGKCTNPYGWSKYMQEQIFKDICTANKELSICSLRYFNPIGSYNYLSDISKTNLIPAIMDVLNGKRDKLLIFGNDYDTKDGTCIRDYIHVSDLAKAHVGMLKFVSNTKGYNIFNIGSGVGYSVLDVINTFEEVNGVKIPYEFAPRRDGDATIAYSNSDKISDTINWKPIYSFKEMLNLKN